VNKLAVEFLGTFWLAPIAGAMLAGVVHKALIERD
jgi:hypothetical protein